MERLDGIHGLCLKDAVAPGVTPDDLAMRAARIYLQMIFRDGFYHADPHPGNFLVLDGGVLGILDGGMVGRLDPDLRAEIEAALFAVVGRDARALSDAVIRLGSLPPDFNRPALRADLGDFLA